MSQKYLCKPYQTDLICIIFIVCLNIGIYGESEQLKVHAEI